MTKHETRSTNITGSRPELRFHFRRYCFLAVALSLRWLTQVRGAADGGAFCRGAGAARIACNHCLRGGHLAGRPFIGERSGERKCGILAWESLATVRLYAAAVLSATELAITIPLPLKSLTFRWHYWTGARKDHRAAPAGAGVGLDNFGDYYASVQTASAPRKM